MMSEGVEFFDVVDRYDSVIGKATRDEVHKLGLLHRSAHLLVFNSLGQVLLQRRSFEKDTSPGMWCSSVSGHLDSGEEYDECVIREAAEEIGLELYDVPERLFKIRACEETGNEFSLVYRANSEGPFFLDEEEVSEARWFDMGELDDSKLHGHGDFSPAFVKVWSRFVEAEKRPIR
ncbi:MAG: NUDIX hydrolase [Euryarchaeota archaeon]|nr:NUDIX hydrolase [Euryarchaeota archaeon]